MNSSTTQCFAINPSEVISIINNQPRTTSLKVAEVFGKLHKNILQRIESLDCSQDFASANFSANVRSEQIGRGAQRDFKFYEMTKDGFMFLVMGFTGKQAARIKEAYIAAFNWMADQLFSKQQTPQTTPDTRTPLRDAVSLLVGKRHLMYPEAYAFVHQRFGVAHIDQLAADQIPQAVEYIHRLALDGEWLPAEKPQPLAQGAYVLSPEEVAWLATMFKLQDKAIHVLGQLREPLRLMQSPLLGSAYDSVAHIRLYQNNWSCLRQHCERVG